MQREDMNHKKRTFEEVRESLRGKVILVVNRGIPAISIWNVLSNWPSNVTV